MDDEERGEDVKKMHEEEEEERDVARHLEQEPQES